MEADFRTLPDLAVRSLGGSVVWANDESFAARQNLVLPAPARFDPDSFDHRGKVYDGWETRRRREPGHDQAIVRLGVPGIVRGVVIDTAWFTGNYPPEASIEATSVSGYPSADELNDTAVWETIVARSALDGDGENAFPVESAQRWTHVRLTIYPDGGVARLRIHGDAVPDPRLLDIGGVDLAALEHGGLVVGCSDMFYGSPNNLLSPGRARSMADGWETARRRDDANDWVTVALAASGVIRMAELDTSYFLSNAPGWAALHGCDASIGDPQRDADWFELLPRTRLAPDTRHQFLLDGERAVTHARLDIYPDGGMARLRLFGALAPEGRLGAGLRWFNALPPAAAVEVLMSASGLTLQDARARVAVRPLTGVTSLPDQLRRLLAGTPVAPG
ncbi:MAG: allantoicase [Pseudonocardiales bacterium]|nr:MAG: allantoicase [Pseudonocardiales bacterium]